MPRLCKTTMSPIDSTVRPNRDNSDTKWPNRLLLGPNLENKLDSYFASVTMHRPIRHSVPSSTNVRVDQSRHHWSASIPTIEFPILAIVVPPWSAINDDLCHPRYRFLPCWWSWWWYCGSTGTHRWMVHVDDCCCYYG